MDSSSPSGAAAMIPGVRRKWQGSTLAMDAAHPLACLLPCKWGLHCKLITLYCLDSFLDISVTWAIIQSYGTEGNLKGQVKYFCEKIISFTFGILNIPWGDAIQILQSLEPHPLSHLVDSYETHHTKEESKQPWMYYHYLFGGAVPKFQMSGIWELMAISTNWNVQLARRDLSQFPTWQNCFLSMKRNVAYNQWSVALKQNHADWWKAVLVKKRNITICYRPFGLRFQLKENYLYV